MTTRSKKKEAAPPPGSRRDGKIKAADAPGGYAPQAVYMAVFLAFLVGFFSGIVLTVTKMRGLNAMPSSSRPAGITAANQGEGAGPSRDEAVHRMMDTLRQKAAREPDNAEAWMQLGHLYFDHGDVDKAADAYRNVLKLDPDNADIWTDLGVMYRRSGRPDEALAAFDRAVAIARTHEIARFNKGVVLLHDLKRGDEALSEWRALLAVNPAFTTPGGQPLEELIRSHESADPMNQTGE
ncbi:MAG: hypothetical protein CSB33_03895 [Desulfobacterales bacterium]|nr:MAG: hypothetical protein CSB33_03895 [Desulfobacterales bacterium]